MKNAKTTIDLNMVNAYIPGRADVGAATAAMIARRDALLGPAYRLEPGDVVRVFPIAERVRNRVTVLGNVYAPGSQGFSAPIRTSNASAARSMSAGASRPSPASPATNNRCLTALSPDPA